MKGDNTELLEILKQTLEVKSPNYPEDRASQSKSQKREKDRLCAFPPTAYWKVIQPRTIGVQEPDNPNFKELQAPATE